MKKTLASLLLGIALILVGGYYFYTSGFLKDISDKSFEFVEKNISERVFTAEPLVKEEDDINPVLSVSGVIAETNKHRIAAGLEPLIENTVLNVSAQRKVDDMFDRQYFEHEAPTGEGAGDVVKDAGYEFIIVGENLALGNYKDDPTLVQAWMDSPGHRENILKSGYTEIGVAVAKGTFNGKSTWLAVQHFAKPLSDCPAINAGIKSQIDANNAQLDAMKVDIEQRRAELQASQPETREEREEHNRKVDEFNVLVDSYNALLDTTKMLVGDYNLQVQKFNACAQVEE